MLDSINESAAPEFMHWFQLQPGFDSFPQTEYDIRFIVANGMAIPIRYSPYWDVLFISSEHMGLCIGQNNARLVSLIKDTWPLKVPYMVLTSYVDLVRYDADIILRREGHVGVMHAKYQHETPMPSMELTGVYTTLGSPSQASTKRPIWGWDDIPESYDGGTLAGQLVRERCTWQIYEVHSLTPCLRIHPDAIKTGLPIRDLITYLGTPQIWHNFHKSLTVSSLEPSIIRSLSPVDNANFAALSLVAHTLHQQSRNPSSGGLWKPGRKPWKHCNLITTYTLSDGCKAVATLSGDAGLSYLRII